MKEDNNLMEKLVSLCKQRGFIYQGSEIYGGLAGTWDYGPLGVALKNNLKNLWWKRFVLDREDMYGFDAAILMNQNVWKASGHVGGFSDPLVECKKCQSRFRVDHLDIDSHVYNAVINEFILMLRSVLDEIHNEVDKPANLFKSIQNGLGKLNISNDERLKIIESVKSFFPDLDQKLDFAKSKLDSADSLVEEIRGSDKYLGAISQIYLNRHIKCPVCKAIAQWSLPRQFNMMFQTNVGAIQDENSISYLRPETAQGMFVNFKNIVDSFHPKLPFGLAQIGKAFRNEIAPRDFTFRTREFEQMEIEYFVKPENWENSFEEFRKEVHAYTKDIGLDENRVHELEVGDGDRAHYSKRTIDFEFDYPFGKKELYGLAYRTDYDLGAHTKDSRVDLSYFEEESKSRFIPHVIEPSFGVDRTLLAVLTNAYTEDEMGGEKRVYLKFSPKVAPVKIAVFPLLKNKENLVRKAREIFKTLKSEFGNVVFDDNGNVGKRYRRQDEIGTPFCITVDFDTIEKDNTVTVRDRDTGEQERIVVDELKNYFKSKF